MKVMLAFVAFAIMVPRGAAAERAKSPADATVFVRLVGSVHVEVEQFGVRQAADMDHVEIGTGSGFVISPDGYVLTNDHVVSDKEQIVVTSGTKKATFTLKASRIDVCFRPGAAAAFSTSAPCSEAAVSVSDPTLDLAVLFINGSNLPYVALGDSDAVRTGLPVDALGYPFGRELEVGKVATAPDLVPEVTTTSGTISAFRDGDAGTRRYLQISNSVNPGNSGGPLVDRDGFALGVIRMKLTTGAGIAFAIPINEAKAFLESNGLDHLLPSRRVRLGPFQSFEAKKIGLRLAEGLGDISPFRLRVETDPQSSEIALRIDRVLSPWNPKQVEQALVGTQLFERVSSMANESQTATGPGGASIVLGHAAGTSPDNREIRMDYAILDLGAEKLVARYVGSAERVAFNESVLRESLAGLEGQPLVGSELGPAEKVDWSAPVAANGQRVLPLPSGWVLEPSGPLPCQGLPQPSAVVAAFPERDFSVTLRAAVWSGNDVLPDQAASACSSRRGLLGAASYASRRDWLGVSYTVEGAFTRISPTQIIQLEVSSPDQKSALARDLLAEWIKKASEP